jgi:hypothetical protein
MENGQLVEYVGPAPEGFRSGPPSVGQIGVYCGPGDESHWTMAGETLEQKEARCAAYTKTHSLVRWEGCTYPWNVSNKEIRAILETGGR